MLSRWFKPCICLLLAANMPLHGPAQSPGDLAHGKELLHKIAVLNDQGNYQAALEAGQQALALYTRLHDPIGIGAAYHNIGNDYQYLGETQQAIRNYLQASEIFQNAGDKRNYLNILNNIASIFIDLSEFDKAYSYASRSVALARELRDTAHIATGLINQGICEQNENRTDTAIRHFEEVVRWGKYLNNYVVILEGYYNLGNAYDGPKTLHKAIQEYLTALPIAREHGNPHYELYLQDGLSDCYTGLGQWARAETYITDAINIAKRVNARRELSIMYANAATISEKRGQLRKALYYKDESQKLNDSLLNEKTRTGIHELEIKYQTAQKDKALSDQALLLIRNQTTLRNRNILLLLSFAGILVLLVLTFLSYRFYRQKQRLGRQTILAMQKEQEVVRLKAKMEGQDQERQRIAMEMHDDIGAGLTAISFLADQLRTRGSEGLVAGRISDTANALVNKMKDIVWSMNKDRDSLDDLIAYLRFNAAELLESAGIDYRFTAPDDIPAVSIPGEQRRNIYLVVKECLHNIVKHARAGFVTIAVVLCGDQLRITICDDGTGIDTAVIGLFGNGLNNMRQRMANIGGGFDLACGRGTQVTLSLKVNL